MGPLALLSLGPTLIRAAGKLLGGKAEQAAENVAAIVDEVKGLEPKIGEAKVASRMAELPMDQLLDFKKVEAQLAGIEKEREANRLVAETAQHRETQATHRTEAESTDEYVRRTRPRLARRSAELTFAYAAVTGALFPIVNAFAETNLPAPDAWIIGTLFAPCLAYMGVRTADKVFGKKP